MPRLPRPPRIPVVGARAQIATTVADVVNLSRTGALVRTTHHQRPGAEWPLVLELRKAAVTLKARVVRCDAAAVPRHGARRQYMLGLAFIEPSKEAQTVIDDVCKAANATAPKRRLYMSFVRRCPACKSRAVQKELKRHYACSDCGLLFTGVRVGIVRFAR